MGVQKVPESMSPKRHPVWHRKRVHDMNARFGGVGLNLMVRFESAKETIQCFGRNEDHHAHARFRTSDLFIKASNACGLRQRSNGRVMFERSNPRNQIWRREGARGSSSTSRRTTTSMCSTEFEDSQI
ncbi:hypothetical protein QL285_096819 [Trifolium repens]|nr:hypothetical protein QL285_096819 [Trifolium repens]